VGDRDDEIRGDIPCADVLGEREVDEFLVG
jgi:hypothetical protein